MARLNRAARRRAKKFHKKQKKITSQDQQNIIDKYWRDVWHFNDLELTIHDHITNQVIKFFPGV